MKIGDFVMRNPSWKYHPDDESYMAYDSSYLIPGYKYRVKEIRERDGKDGTVGLEGDFKSEAGAISTWSLWFVRKDVLLPWGESTTQEGFEAP